MKKKKRIFPKILIAAVILILLAAVFGGNGEEDKEKKVITDDTKNTAEASNDTTGDQADGNTKASHSAELPTIEEAVLVDKGDVKITALEYVEDSLWGQGIKVKIENNSKDNIAVTLNSMSANNYMVTDDLFYCDVAAGKTGNDTIYLSDSFLRSAGIEMVADITMDFHVSSSDSYETLFDVPHVQLSTSASGSISQPALDDGKELYNQDEIRIVGQYVDEDSFWGTAVELFIENTSSQNVIIQCENMSINGCMVEGYFSTQVNAGKMAIDSIEVMESDLENNNITEVNDVELNFIIVNPNTYETIAESGPVAFHAE